MTEIKAIFFDYGGVFTRDGSMKALLDHCHKKYGKDVSEINPELIKIWDEARLGRVPANLYWDLMGKHLDAKGVDIVNESLSVYGFENDVYDFAKELKKKHKLGMITNQVKDWFEIILQKRGLDKIFDIIITSYESGLAKPDPAIYLLAAEKMGVSPEECVFIDDMEKNIIGAVNVGMKAIQFQNLEQLKNDLKKMEIE